MKFSPKASILLTLGYLVYLTTFGAAPAPQAANVLLRQSEPYRAVDFDREEFAPTPVSGVPRDFECLTRAVVGEGDSFESILAKQGISPGSDDYEFSLEVNRTILEDRWMERCEGPNSGDSTTVRLKPERGYCADPESTLLPGDEIVVVWHLVIEVVE